MLKQKEQQQKEIVQRHQNDKVGKIVRLLNGVNKIQRENAVLRR